MMKNREYNEKKSLMDRFCDYLEKHPEIGRAFDAYNRSIR